LLIVRSAKTTPFAEKRDEESLIDAIELRRFLAQAAIQLRSAAEPLLHQAAHFLE
jgi:hypothetical protein